MFFIAAAAMTFASCQKEMTDLSKETLSFNLNLNANVEQTKTYLGDDNVVLWGTTEAVTLYVGSEDGAKFFDSTTTSEFAGKSSASFSFTIDGVTEAESYTLGGIYPASVSAGIDNKSAEAYKIALPETQNAYFGNYDPKAFIMVLKPDVVNEIPDEYTASFRRAVALNKITLTNVAEEITSVEITVPEGKYLAGRRYVDLTTAEFGEIYENGGRTNTIKVNSDFAITDNSIDVWFTSWGVEIASGEQLTIKMVSETSTYTRTITARAEGINFVEGDMNLLTVNMENAEKESLEDFSGQYLIAAMPGAWNLMSGTNPGKYFDRLDSKVTTAADAVKCSDFYELENIEDYVWTVGQMEGGYSIKNNSTNKYVSYSGSANDAYTSDAPIAFALSLNEGVMTVESVAVSGRKLKYNSSSPRFAFYTSDQQSLYFIPWVPDETPRISVSETEISVDAEATEVTFEYITKNITGDVSVEVADDATMTTVKASASEGVVTVTFDENVDAEGKTATIILSYDGAVSKEVVINQAAAGAVKQYYVKVTSAPADWSGTYLIVANTSAANGTITSKWLKFNSVAINDNKIATSDETNGIAATIVKDSDGYYTIMFANGNYLGTTNKNDGIKVTTANITDEFKWQFSVSSELVKITTKANSERYLRLNGTSGFRTYTNNTTGTQATLYRLESVN